MEKPGRSWQMYQNTSPSYISDMQRKPQNFKISGNYPNPFNPTTTIFFNLTAEHAEDAELIIYNMRGQKIKQYSIFNNQYSITWDGTDENGDTSINTYPSRTVTDVQLPLIKIHFNGKEEIINTSSSVFVRAKRCN